MLFVGAVRYSLFVFVRYS